MPAFHDPFDDDPTKKRPKSSPWVTIGLPLALIFLCAVSCILLFIYVPIFSNDDIAETTTTAEAERGGELTGPTPTSFLDAAFSSGDGGGSSPTPSPTSTQTPASVLAPAASSDADSATETAQDPPEIGAVDYAWLLILESNLFILEQHANRMQFAEENQSQADSTLQAIEQALTVIEPALVESPAVDVDPAFVESRVLANDIFQSVKVLVRSWRENEIGPGEAVVALIPIREQLNRAFDLIEQAFADRTGIDLSRARQARVEAVRTEFSKSLSSAIESAELAPSTLAAVPVSFSETDLPLSTNISPGVARTYVARILELIPNFSTTQTTLTELLAQKPKAFVADPRDQKITLGIATVRASSRIIKNIELPATLATTRQDLLVALLDCDTASLYLESGFRNSQDFETGLDFLRSCNSKLLNPTEALTAFLGEGAAQAGGSDSTSSKVEKSSCSQGCTELLPGCIIKGELTVDNFRVYHLPGEALYGQVQINPAQAERWFCTVEAAIANGFLSVRIIQGL